MKRYGRITASLIALTLVYFCAGKFGLSLALLNPSASVVWPPSGIALAVLLLWGYRLWPAIFLGAFLVNITTQGTVGTTLGIAAGNTLEALLGAWLVNRFAHGIHAFERAKNVFLFILLAAVLSTAVSATCGVTTLSLAGFAPWHEYPSTWLTWWLGDLVGDLIFAPLLVIWVTQGLSPLEHDHQRWEALSLAAVTVVLSWLIFLSDIPSGLEYLALPPVLWAALRFGGRGAVSSAFVTSAIALLGTSQSFGPFTTPDRNQSLFLLQSFMAALTVTALVLAAVLSERRRAEGEIATLNHRLASDLAAMSRLQQLSTQLVQANDLTSQLPEILDVALKITGDQTGSIQLLDTQTGVLKTVAQSGFGVTIPGFFESVHSALFACLEGMPTSARLIIEDLAPDSPLAGTAVCEILRQRGVKALQSTPLTARSGRVVGQLSTFSRASHRPTEAQLRLLDILSRQATVLIGRTRAYGLLRQSEERLRAVVETAVDGIITISEQGAITSVNPAAEHVFGYSAPEMIGKNIALLMPDPYRIGYEGYLADYLRTNERKIIGSGREVEGRHKDGTLFPLDLAVSETLIDSHRFFTGIIRDISARKQAEAALQEAKDELTRSNEELERRVQARTQELQQTNAALMQTIEEEKRLELQLHQAQKMESIGTLAGGIAHDFNNFLNVIKGYASLLADDHQNDHELANSLRIIDETVDRGAATVQQLMTIARKSEVRFERVDLNVLLEKLQGMLRGFLPATIEIEMAADASILPVWADPNQLDQVLLNICINARDAMPGGGTLQLNTGLARGVDLQERFHDAADGSYACIAIKDTGMGMSETVRHRIFEPFYTTKDLGEGTGLGLSVAYGIITNHRGFIDVASEPGAGTTFRVYLPLADVCQRAAEPALVAKPPIKTSTTDRVVLFVEDEILQLEVMRKTLEAAGFRVLAAKDGVEAVELFSRHKDEISIAVLDLGLPKLNGWEALQRMKAIKPTLKAIIASGNISATIESAMARGELSALIRKPYRPSDIVEKISLTA